MNSTEHSFDWLQRWYTEQCDGDWEHSWGIKIGPLDNPGWTVAIDLEKTSLEDRDYSAESVRRSETDWIFTRVQERRFEASCGPGNLTEVLTMFRLWAEGAKADSGEGAMRAGQSAPCSPLGASPGLCTGGKTLQGGHDVFP
ncbi:immunity 53 family protein [Streptomyces sp. NBC_01304]|uniref:immunity 53 family protein n=1 Tax=Streptomyces sp. NBC_01304 TaxID=2903818 RepID=UPI002E1407FC|nr:immunity 53 family protein [Streptomyces sp. NBC_01304]